MAHYYHLYGLTIECPIPLPEAVEMTAIPEKVDAFMRFAMPPAWVLEEYRSGKYASINENAMWYRIEDDFLMYVENGKDVCIWVINDAVSDLRLRAYILTGAMTFLLLQRNFLLIHGSALVKDGTAFLISGPSGSGKSTTALELLKDEEISFASDDICAIEVTPTACTLFPGPPLQKVCPDVVEREPDEDYIELDEFCGKYGKRLTGGYEKKPLPVSTLFLITKSENDITNPDTAIVSIKEITGFEKVTRLTQNLFRGELLNILGVGPNRMQQFLAASKQIRIFEVIRPGGNINTLSDVVNKINDTLDFYQSC